MTTRQRQIWAERALAPPGRRADLFSMRRSREITPAVEVLPAAAPGSRRWRRSVPAADLLPADTAPAAAAAPPAAAPAAAEAQGPDVAPAAAVAEGRDVARAALTELSNGSSATVAAAVAAPAPSVRPFNGRLSPDGRPAGEQPPSPERQIAGLMHELRMLSGELDVERGRAVAERERLLQELEAARDARLAAEAELAAARHALATRTSLPTPRQDQERLTSLGA